MHHAFTLVGGDGSIWGCGLRSNGNDKSQEQFKQITLPADCVNFKKVCQGKFVRVILTENNKLFWSGQNRKYMWASGTGNSFD